MMSKLLKEKELNNVNGGSKRDFNYETWGHFHTGCKGRILNVGDPFRSCKCAKCGETHYWFHSFNSYHVTQIALDKYVITYSDGRTETVTEKPKECE